MRERLPFTTSYHTRFPEYLRARLPAPEAITYAWMRRFHNAAAATLVATPSLAQELGARGFTRVKPWTRGVDTELFLKSRHPGAHFLGEHVGETLARIYASADVFVFPSRTDTFGIVLLEALASGLPVAAYPVTGPLDVVGEAGVLSQDLGQAARAALAISRDAARQRALGYSWRACAEMFLGHVKNVYAEHADGRR
jgi:hypothetical protein